MSGKFNATFYTTNSILVVSNLVWYFPDGAGAEFDFRRNDKSSQRGTFMKTLRILALTSLVAGFGLMTGCDTTASSSAPEITQFETANFTDATDTWTSGMDLEFYGTAKDDNSLKTIKLDIVGPSGTVVETITKNVSGTSVDFGGNKTIVLTIKNTGAWVAGAYTAKLTATDNDGLATTKTITLAKVAGTGSSATTTPLTAQGTLNVGGFSTSAPSFIGLGTNPAVAYSGTESKTSFASIDLVVTANANGTASVFESTAEGVSNGDLTSSYWGAGRATLIAKVTTAPANLEAAKAVALSAQSAEITSGGIYVVKTVGGVYAVLTASSVTDYGDAVKLTVSILK